MSLIYHLGKAETSQEGVKDLVKDLESCVDTLENMNKILSKSKNFNGGYSESQLYKGIEDGILDSIHNANSHQLSYILNGDYEFRFYTEFNDKELLRLEVQKRLRDKKLNDLGLFG